MSISVTGVDIWVMKLHLHLNIFDLVMGSIVQIMEQTVPAEAILFIKVQQYREMKYPVKNSKVEDMDPLSIISHNQWFNFKVTCETNKECWVQWLNAVKILWEIWLQLDKCLISTERQCLITPDKTKEELTMTIFNIIYNNTMSGSTKILVASILRLNYPPGETIKIYVLNLTWMNGVSWLDFKTTKQKK